MITRLQQGVLIYCDQCEAHLGPFEHQQMLDDAAICRMLTNSKWRTGFGPAVGIEPVQVQYCTDCEPLPKCQMCARVARPGNAFCGDHCRDEYGREHD